MELIIKENKKKIIDKNKKNPKWEIIPENKLEEKKKIYTKKKRKIIKMKN